jgi:hypothetical protein
MVALFDLVTRAVGAFHADQAQIALVKCVFAGA